jgi:hypothetical protein
MSCIISQIYADMPDSCCQGVVDSIVCLEACVFSPCNISEQVSQMI